jgi:hypothetical protein
MRDNHSLLVSARKDVAMSGEIHDRMVSVNVSKKIEEGNFTPSANRFPLRS